MNHSPNTGALQIVHVHTPYLRADALTDGALIDVTTTAREAGYLLPFALTKGAWDEAVAWDEANCRDDQDQSGRLWDVLWLARRAARRVGHGMSRIAFEVLRVPNEPDALDAVTTTLHVHIGPGDAHEAVLTVLLPHED
ncbi:DUF6573 family protein [Cellulomonas sp. 179-A 4D5 NHS]|uniref:DUF6573 family protein n=1 Tax=Cellulomonas sp. 179-A 4D5 NHS TaxID=3142378 RepID=UPI0039A3B78F